MYTGGAGSTKTRGSSTPCRTRLASPSPRPGSASSLSVAMTWTAWHQATSSSVRVGIHILYTSKYIHVSLPPPHLAAAATPAPKFAAPAYSDRGPPCVRVPPAIASPRRAIRFVAVADGCPCRGRQADVYSAVPQPVDTGACVAPFAPGVAAAIGAGRYMRGGREGAALLNGGPSRRFHIFPFFSRI